MSGLRVMETYRFRLMVYESKIGRSRWYGAALAAAIAYMAAGLVTNSYALTVVTVDVILAGVALAFQLFLYENSALQLRWLIDAKQVSPDAFLQGPMRSRPFLRLYSIH